ncbi:competence/damage-inducible protein A [Hypericibacter sp.]|uniref:competence/damage-inducible protein A n=1 Tax=Hypericibacter sp. TaxID=2705401 RepID=UPI003D6D7844
MSQDSASVPSPTAAVLIIGNEILSGRTQDVNLAYLAKELSALGIPLREARVVPDIEAEIVAAVNAVRARYSYVFTTGGIGPTHDDITSGCVAKAFGVELVLDPEAVALLRRHYTGDQLNEARLRMATVPKGSRLIENPVSTAPGFQIGNVYVLAGVPAIMRAMFDGLKGGLKGGRPVSSRTVSTYLGEGVIAQALGALQQRFPKVDIGSYPFFRRGKFGTSLVARSTDETELDQIAEGLRALIRDLGGEPHEGEIA